MRSIRARRLRLSCPPLTLAALLLGIAGPASAGPPDQGHPAALPAPTLSPPPPPGLPPEKLPNLLAAADDITRQVVALRGLSLVKPFQKGVLSREAIGAKLRERIAKEYTPGEIQIEARVLKRLGLLPPDADYEKLVIDLLMEQVAGFYDPFARELYIADWLGLDLQRPALAHEIEHALQDQHFDLKKFASPLKEDGDRQLARSAVVEGDGTAVMLDFVAQQMGLDLSKLPGAIDAIGDQLASGAMASSPAFDRAPRFLRESLIFPYVAGMKFVLTLRRPETAPGATPPAPGPKKGKRAPAAPKDPAEVGWARVDEAFRNPPESTEQVIHPQKFLAREHPVAIAAAPILALAPLKELRRDVLGELEFRVLFASRLSDGVAERAAEGWGGDRMVAYGEPEGAAGPLTVIDLSTWDSDDDAVQVESALRRLLPKLADRPEVAPDAAAVYARGDETWSVERRGREVLALFGVARDARAPVTDEVWKKWKVARPGAADKP